MPERARGNEMKDEGINQRTYMYNPWSRTTIWALAWGGERIGLGKGEEREKKQDCNNINNKNKI